MKSNTISKKTYVNIDTVNISMDIEDIISKRADLKNKEELIAEIVEPFTNRLVNKKITTGQGFTTIGGSFKNYYVEITNNRISMFGSLCKFYHGNNLFELTYQDLKEALKMLKNESGLPIYAATIVRIDVGMNLITKQRIKDYLDQFDETPYWVRHQRITSLYFNKANQSLTFYDKAKELQKHDKNTFGLITDKNVMRIESKSLKQVQQTFKYEKPVKVVMLLTPTFRKKLFLKFIKDYQSINTRKTFSLLNARNVPDIKNMTYFNGMEHFGGLKEYMKTIVEVKKENNWPYSKMSTVRQWIKRVIENTPAIEETDLILEINELILTALNETDLISLE